MDVREKNFDKLMRTSIPMNFVKKHNGSWDHQKWEDFCSFLEMKKYTPIDFAKVGSLLEGKKNLYLEKNK
jgi:hypothetical protein